MLSTTRQKFDTLIKLASTKLKQDSGHYKSKGGKIVGSRVKPKTKKTRNAQTLRVRENK